MDASALPTARRDGAHPRQASISSRSPARHHQTSRTKQRREGLLLYEQARITSTPEGLSHIAAQIQSSKFMKADGINLPGSGYAGCNKSHRMFWTEQEWLKRLCWM